MVNGIRFSVLIFARDLKKKSKNYNRIRKSLLIRKGFRDIHMLHDSNLEKNFYSTMEPWFIWLKFAMVIY